MRLAVDRTSVWWLLANSACIAGAMFYRAYDAMLRLDLWAMEHTGDLLTDDEARALWESILSGPNGPVPESERE